MNVEGSGAGPSGLFDRGDGAADVPVPVRFGVAARFAGAMALGRRAVPPGVGDGMVLRRSPGGGGAVVVEGAGARLVVVGWADLAVFGVTVVRGRVVEVARSKEPCSTSFRSFARLTGFRSSRALA